MCRYAMSAYKPHYACFNCRKTFKRRLMADIQRGEGTKNEAKCPECGEFTASMGLDFESPKKNDLKNWAHLKSLYSVGITFHSCGCTGPGYIPNTTERLIVYFEELKAEYFKNIEFWRSRFEPTTRAELDRDESKNGPHLWQIPKSYRANKEEIKNEEAIKFWLGKVKEVEGKLAIIK
jgi:DNA-directed RNA polymerase subunit RPC12/RpoP